MVRAVFFDIGGVVYTSVSEQFTKVVKEAFGIDDCVPTNPQYDFVQDLFRKLETTTIGEKGFWESFATHVNKPLPANWQTLMPKVFSAQIAREAMLRFIESLKAKGIKVYVLSNVSKEKAEENKKKGVYDIFDGIILSCDVHKWKPDEEIFLYALQYMHAKPEESLFIDDVLINVDAAKQVGMHAMQFINEEQFFREIERYRLV